MSVEVDRLIDSGTCVVLFKNDLGSVTAMAVENDKADLMRLIIDGADECDATDDCSAIQAMSRLADKLMQIGDYTPEANP